VDGIGAVNVGLDHAPETTATEVYSNTRSIRLSGGLPPILIGKEPVNGVAMLIVGEMRQGGDYNKSIFGLRRGRAYKIRLRVFASLKRCSVEYPIPEGWSRDRAQARGETKVEGE